MMTKKYAVEGLDGYPNELAHKLDDAWEINAALVGALEELVCLYSNPVFVSESISGMPRYFQAMTKAKQALTLADGDKDA